MTEPTSKRPWAFRIVFVLNLLALGVVAGLRLDRDEPETEWLFTNAQSRFVDVEGVRTHYRDHGSGTPLVLVHGEFSSLQTWDGWARELSPHRRVIRIDLPGFGLSGPDPVRDYRDVRYARFVLAFLDAIHVGRVDLAGHGLGASVAIRVALEAPSRVRRLVLLDAWGLSGRSRPLVHWLARTPVLDQLPRWFTPTWWVRIQLRRAYGDDRRVSRSVVARYEALWRRRGNRQAFLDRSRSIPDRDLDSRLREIRVPTLVQWGEVDRLVPLAFADRFHRGIPGAVLRLYPGVGHLPMEERPVETARDVETFLAAP